MTATTITTGSLEALLAAKRETAAQEQAAAAAAAAKLREDQEKAREEYVDAIGDIGHADLLRRFNEIDDDEFAQVEADTAATVARVFDLLGLTAAQVEADRRTIAEYHELAERAAFAAGVKKVRLAELQRAGAFRQFVRRKLERGSDLAVSQARHRLAENNKQCSSLARELADLAASSPILVDRDVEHDLLHAGDRLAETFEARKAKLISVANAVAENGRVSKRDFVARRVADGLDVKTAEEEFINLVDVGYGVSLFLHDREGNREAFVFPRVDYGGRGLVELFEGDATDPDFLVDDDGNFDDGDFAAAAKNANEQALKAYRYELHRLMNTAEFHDNEAAAKAEIERTDPDLARRAAEKR